jgi:hypothetical protein
MNHLKVVFSVIKERCKDVQESGSCSFSSVEHIAAGWHVFLPLYLYIEVLQSLGMITINNYTKKIILTEKGKVSDIHLPDHFHAHILLVLFLARRLALFILFWPVFLFARKPYSAEE